MTKSPCITPDVNNHPFITPCNYLPISAARLHKVVSLQLSLIALIATAYLKKVQKKIYETREVKQRAIWGPEQKELTFEASDLFLIPVKINPEDVKALPEPHKP